MKPPISALWGRLRPLLDRYKAVLLVLAAGVLLLLSGGRDKPADIEIAAQDVPPAAADGFDLSDFQNQLERQLAAIDGAGRVSLLLSLDETEEAVYVVDTRTTTNGADSQSEERSLAVLSDGSYGETPVTVKHRLPSFRGAVVLCDGADSDAVRLSVTQAVTVACDMGADKVSVLKMSPAA